MRHWESWRTSIREGFLRELSFGEAIGLLIFGVLIVVLG